MSFLDIIFGEQPKVEEPPKVYRAPSLDEAIDLLRRVVGHKGPTWMDAADEELEDDVWNFLYRVKR